MAYIFGLVDADIVNAGGDQGKIQIAGAGRVYDPAVVADSKALADLRSIAVNPQSANGHTAYGTALTPAEQALFVHATLNNDALATHAAAILLNIVREAKTSPLDDTND